MKLLALEFSTNQRSVALLSEEGVLAYKAEEGTRSKSGVALVAAILLETKVAPAEITKIAVGLGPGSYTGVRSAIAIAQGCQLARGVILMGISSMEVLARDAQKERIKGEIEIIIDAQRDELYRARYSLDQAPPALLEKIHLSSVKELAPGVKIAGPEATRYVASAQDLFPRADTLGELAWERNDTIPGEKLAPIYLRETTFLKAPHASK